MLVILEVFWGFENSSIQVSFEFKHDAHMEASLVHYQKLGMWQLTPTKQKSRPEIQA